MDSLTKEKGLKYLKYAAGEIVLVVIGILIALQINAWSERVKQEDRVSDILTIIKNDLEQDTQIARIIIENYNTRKPIIEKLINDSMTDMEIDSSDAIGALLFSYNSFEFQDMGYQLIKKEESILKQKRKRTLQKIIKFYAHFHGNITRIGATVEEDVKLNLRFYVNEYDWFYKIFTPSQQAFKEHVKNKTTFKNRLVTHEQLVYGNYIPLLEQYSSEATELLKELENYHD